VLALNELLDPGQVHDVVLARAHRGQVKAAAFNAVALAHGRLGGASAVCVGVPVAVAVSGGGGGGDGGEDDAGVGELERVGLALASDRGVASGVPRGQAALEDAHVEETEKVARPPEAGGAKHMDITSRGKVQKNSY